MKARIRLWTAVVLLLALLAVGLWASCRMGLDSARLEAAIRAESARVQARLDDRFDLLERKVDGLETRLERIESKIDRLIELATPRLPDGMELAP